jgi:hypothetical protein
MPTRLRATRGSWPACAGRARSQWTQGGTARLQPADMSGQPTGKSERAQRQGAHTHRELLVADAHDDGLSRRPRGASGRHSKLGGDRFGLTHEGVVAGRVEVVGHTPEHTGAKRVSVPATACGIIRTALSPVTVVRDRRHLAMHNLAAPNDFTAKDLDNGLMTQADAQDWDLSCRWTSLCE